MCAGGRRPQEVGEIADSLVSFWETSQKSQQKQDLLNFSKYDGQSDPKETKACCCLRGGNAGFGSCCGFLVHLIA